MTTERFRVPSIRGAGKSGMTDGTKRVLSILVMVVLVIQVVFPGGLFSFDVQKANAAVTVTVTTPTDVTNWDIGDTNNIRWTSAFGIGEDPSYFKLYYSEDSGSSWNLIDGNVPYTGSPQLYGWETPVVNGAGESDFQVKVEAYDVGNNLLASDASDNFKIDYGPVDSWDANAEPSIAKGLYIDLTLTPKDKYDNAIIGYYGSVDISGFLTHGDGSGEVGNSVWFNGQNVMTLGAGAYVMSLNNISTVNGSVTLTTTFTSDFSYVDGKLTFDVLGDGYDESIIYGDLVLIDAPTAASSFVIGSSGNSITFRAGGETAIDHLDLAYSPDNGSNYYTIEDGVADGTMPQTYSWTVNNNTPGAQWKVRVKSYTAADALIATGTSAAFTVAYGSVAKFTVEAPDAANINQYFSLTVTAKDTNDYIITTFDNPVAIGSLPSNITPVTIGNGTSTGSWSNGVVTYAGFAISGTGDQTITATYSGATGQDTIKIIGGGSENIVGCIESKDKTAPSSVVAGILDTNNNIQPMPATTFKSPITVVVEATDPYQGIFADSCPLGTGVETVDLQLKKGAGAYASQSGGTYIVPPANAKPGYDYYKWTLDIPSSTYATWYFYSIA
ncbi:MAG: hypothetical protein V1807_01770, partial [Patescibacteria group bacterium]